jgi:hypothetical protein
MGNFFNKQKINNNHHNQIINYNGKFWKYCEINIPDDINCVPSLDRVNMHYKDGSETEVFGTCKPYTIKEYQAKYSIVGIDGKLYWKE